MDEMRLKLSTKFMRNIAGKLLSRFIFKEYGYKVDIQFDDLDVWVLNGDATVKANVELKLKNTEFMKIMKSAGLD